jgi:hypothetical protein
MGFGARYFLLLGHTTIVAELDTYRVAYLVLKKGLQHIPTTKVDAK